MRTLVIILGVLLVARVVGAETTPPCDQGISRETTERLFAVLTQPLAEANCRFEGVHTNRSRLEARWTYKGTTLPPVIVVPRACASDAARVVGELAVEVPPEIIRDCPSVAALIAPFEQQVASERIAGRQGSARDPLFRAARGLFLSLALIALLLAARGVSRLRTVDPRWPALALAAFVGALALRAALPFTLGNWYSEVLPASGPPPWMRFGPGFFALQSLLRDIGMWNADALRWSQLIVGAAAAPLLIALLHELRISLPGAAAAAILLILAPFHARLSATTSEHVLASTLCLALLVAWMRAYRRRDPLCFAAALVLFPVVCATRVDMTVQAALTLPWPLLRDHRERGGERIPWMMVAGMALVALASALVAYGLIALPSRHPMPDRTWFMFALRYFIPQFWWLSTSDPYWLSLSSVLLAGIGMVVMIIRRPLLFLRVAATVTAAFVISGHTFMHDELVGARYFLFLVPIFVIASGYGFAALLDLMPPRRRASVAIAGLLALALWTGFAARAAYAARYTFQDEYDFARAALAALPAGCTVYQERLRVDGLPGDPDCCLDVARSPLVLDFPQLQFTDLPDNRAAADASGCAAYYEGTACAIVPGSPERVGFEFARTVSAHFQPRCATVHQRQRLALIDETRASPRTTRGLFDAPPPARLYRWTP